jgi:hypothetical protein
MAATLVTHCSILTKPTSSPIGCNQQGLSLRILHYVRDGRDQLLGGHISLHRGLLKFTGSLVAVPVYASVRETLLWLGQEMLLSLIS